MNRWAFKITGDRVCNIVRGVGAEDEIRYENIQVRDG